MGVLPVASPSTQGFPSDCFWRMSAAISAATHALPWRDVEKILTGIFSMASNVEIIARGVWFFYFR
jgi:hypothetical protein